MFDEGKPEERNQEIPHIDILAVTEIWLKKRARRWQILVPLKGKNGNLLSCLRPLDITTNSDTCIKNRHDSCDGIVKSVIDGLDNTKMCACQCHSSSYQMVQKMFGIINQKE